MIITNELRSVFSSWTDRLAALFLLLIASVAAHVSLGHQGLVLAISAIGAFAAISGAGTAQLIEHRLAFHRYDGVLATDALAGPSRRRYALLFHAFALGIMVAGIMVARPGLLALGPAGYGAGAAASHLATRLTGGSGATGRPILVQSARAFLERPIAGLAAAMLLLLPLLVVKSLQASVLAAVVGLVCAVEMLCLTALDDAAIRFMTISGYGSWRIVWLRARGALIFLAIVAPACLILANSLAAMVIASVTLVALILMAARVLAYRIYTRRTADIVVSLCVGAAAIAGWAAPLLLPFIVGGIFWRVYRRSARAAWLLL